MLTITPKELSILIEKNPQDITLIDVRTLDEYTQSHLFESKHIDLALLPILLHEVNSTKQVIFICRSGGRSGQACEFAQAAGIRAYNLIGGMIAYEKEFPSKVVRPEKINTFGIL